MSHQRIGITKWRDWEFVWGQRTYIMGIINMTPDSFAGDGLGYDVEAAVRLARQFVEQGADIIDVGGESTRPGSAANPFLTAPDQPVMAEPLPVAEELRRIVPTIQRLSAELTVPISIDTYKAPVAREAVAAGASMINDIWGLRYDLELAGVAAEYGLPLIIMHNRAYPHYRDLMTEITADLMGSLNIALAAGVPRESIILDPGLGFGKTLEQNLEIMRGLERLRALGRPLLVGPSRKSMIGRVLDLPVDQRVEGTAAVVTIAIMKGADIVRVHDVAQMARVCRMTDAIIKGSSVSGG